MNNNTTLYLFECTSNGCIFDQWHIALYPIRRFVSIAITTVGAVGNIFTLVLMARRGLSVLPKTTRTWLTSLLLSDLITCVLIFGYFSWFRTTHDSLTNQPLVIRAMVRAGTEVTDRLNAWAQSALIVERALVICVPLKAQIILTTRRTVINLIVITCLSVVTSTPGFLTNFYVKKSAMFTHLDRISLWSKFLTVYVLPFMVIMTSALAMCVGILQSRRRLSASATSVSITGTDTIRGRRRNLRSQPSATRITHLILPVTINFVICHSLFMFMYFVHLCTDDFACLYVYPQSPVACVITITAMYMLKYLDNTTNWALFTLSGLKMRRLFTEQVRLMLPCLVAWKIRHTRRLTGSM